MTDAPTAIYSGSILVCSMDSHTTISGVPYIHSPLIVGGPGITVASGIGGAITVASTITGLPTFFKEADEFSQQTSSQNSWVQRMRMAVNIQEAGLYKFEWFYVWRLDATTEDFRARIELDDSVELMEHREEPKEDRGSQSLPAGGFDFVTLSAGVHTFDLDYRTTDDGAPAEIKLARMFLVRIG